MKKSKKIRWGDECPADDDGVHEMEEGHILCINCGQPHPKYKPAKQSETAHIKAALSR